MRYLISLFVFTFCIASGHCQPLLPVAYDDEIPRIEEVVGHTSGAEITAPEDALAYLWALQAAAPDRMTVTQYATSWEGRKLVYAAIGSPANIARISEIKSDLATLASGDVGSSDRAEIIARTPAIVWLAYSVHGDEISGTDASLALAYHLLAAQNDRLVEEVLANTIVIIDPMQNPDGRNRFINSFEAARGLIPQADRFAAEHDQPWPGGRANHYLFDLNRDWFTLSQPETRGKVAAMQEWSPVVVADIHEMGGDETYFFPPAARPFNPGITDGQKAKQGLIGRNHARWFDGEGIEYFTREVFDAFYPGYGDMWPALNGAIAMTYEQASARGLIWDRRDGKSLSYRDGVRAHFLASLSTAEIVAQNKTRFLEDYAAFRASAIEEGSRAADRFYVFDLGRNKWQAERMARQLVAQGISVHRLSGAVEACGERYQRGVLVVDLAQPAGRLAKTLLARQTDLPEDFLKQQENRRDRGLDTELYDVTAWSVPLMSGVSMDNCSRLDMSEAQRVLADDPETATAAPSNSAFGYAVPWTDAGQAKFVLNALADGFQAKSTGAEFTMDGRSFPRGTVVFSRKANEGADFTQLEMSAREMGTELVGLSSSWTSNGPNLGSSKFRELKAPRIALAWGQGVSSLDAGAARYILEQSFGVPVTPIRTRTLPHAKLELYDVLILPSGGYGGGVLNDAISEFVREGGVVIGFGSALRFLANEDIGLLSTKREKAFIDGSTSDDEAVNGVTDGVRLEDQEDYEAIIADGDAVPDSVPGALLNTVADTTHWLSAGYNEAVALFAGTDIYTPLQKNIGSNVFRYANEDALLASGYLWEENGKQLAYKPFIMVESTEDGITIGFTQSPVTRGYLDGLNLVLLNAILFGPAHAN